MHFRLPHVIITNIVTLTICVLIAMFYPHIGDITRYDLAVTLTWAMRAIDLGHVTR